MSRKARALPSSTPDDTSVPRSRTSAGAAARWRALFGCEPPHGALFIDRAVAWREQVDAAGDVAPAIARDLAIVARQAREARAGAARAARAADVETVSAVPQPSGAPRSEAAPEPACSDARCITSPADADEVREARSAAPRTRSRAGQAVLPPASSQLLPGTRLVKAHGGRNHVVEVTDTSFHYEGAAFASLSAVAKHITGTHWNGLLFFGLRRRKTYKARSTANG